MDEGMCQERSPQMEMVGGEPYLGDTETATGCARQRPIVCGQTTKFQPALITDCLKGPRSSTAGCQVVLGPASELLNASVYLFLPSCIPKRQ
jgi:hypothetical protein